MAWQRAGMSSSLRSLSTQPILWFNAMASWTVGNLLHMKSFQTGIGLWCAMLSVGISFWLSSSGWRKPLARWNCQAGAPREPWPWGRKADWLKQPILKEGEAFTSSSWRSESSGFQMRCKIEPWPFIVIKDPMKIPTRAQMLTNTSWPISNSDNCILLPKFPLQFQLD